MTGFWVEFLATLAIEAALLVIATVISQRFTTSAAWRRTLWQACFVGLAILLSCELIGTRTAIKAVFAHRNDYPAAPSSLGPELPHATLPPQVSSENSLAPGVPIQNRKSEIQDGHDWWPGLAWLAGILVLAILGLARRILLFGFQRRCAPATNSCRLQVEALARQLGIKRSVRVITSARLISPISFGAFRPTVCVPANFAEVFTAPEQEAVLLHELAHVAARDSLWLLSAETITALLWWHPLVWWAQRELRSATEVAADETSALLVNGPQVLAGCLVNLGTRFTDSAGFNALGIHGVRFRSGLGRRVQRLFSLSRTRWTALPLWRSRATQFCVPTLCVTAIVTCGAWATTTKGENMKSWKQSLAGLAAVSLLQTLQAEPGTKPGDALTVAANKPAKPKGDAASLPTLSEINVASKNTQMMRKRLENIVFEEVTYDGLPLGEVVRMLMGESLARDPDKRGVNFVFAQPRFVVSPPIDPATGLPAGTAPEPIDLQSVTIRIIPPLKNIRLIDLLEVIRKVADRPIEYTIHEYGVVFTAAPTPGTPVIPEAVHPTIARTFKIDPQVFFPAINKTFGVSIKTQSVDSVRSGLAQFLAALGIDIYAPNRAVFYNDLNGVLLVRATEEEMIMVDAAMQTIGAVDGIRQ